MHFESRECQMEITTFASTLKCLNCTNFFLRRFQLRGILKVVRFKRGDVRTVWELGHVNGERVKLLYRTA